MLFETSRQAPLFLLFFCCGAAQGVFYALLYALRRSGKKLPTVIADVLFVLFFFASCAFTLLAGNGGTFQFYQFLAVLLGIAASCGTLGFFLKKVIDFLAEVLYNIYVWYKNLTQEKGRIADGGKTK